MDMVVFIRASKEKYVVFSGSIGFLDHELNENMGPFKMCSLLSLKKKYLAFMF